MDSVKISDFSIGGHNYVRRGYKYRVKDILTIADNLTEFEIPISGIDIGIMPWKIDTIKEFCYHVNRLNNCNFDKPVILDDEGCICDGWHRVAKAVLEGKLTITAKRLLVMPEDCGKSD